MSVVLIVTRMAWFSLGLMVQEMPSLSRSPS